MVRSRRRSSPGEDVPPGSVFLAVRSRLAFPPSPTPLKVYNPTEGPPPPRARRFQKRRDDKEKENNAFKSYATPDSKTIQSLSISPNKVESTPLLRLPLLEKGIQSSNQLNHHRDNVSKKRPSIELDDDGIDTTTTKPTTLRSEPNFDHLVKETDEPVSSVDSVEPHLKEASAFLNAKKATKKGSSEGDKKGNAPSCAITPTQQSIEVVINGSPNYTRKAKSSPIKLNYAVKKDSIQTPPEKKRRLISDAELNPTDHVSQQTSSNKEIVEQTTQPTKGTEAEQLKETIASSPSRKRPRSRKSKKSPAPSHDPEAPVAEEDKQASTHQGSASTKEAIVKSSDNKTKSAQGRQPVNEELPTKALPKRAQAQIGVEAPIDKIPLFLENDGLAMSHLLPPSSPRRFADWKKDAAPSSEDDDLEYVDPTHYSELRLEEDQRGISGAVDNGRLGATEDRASVSSPKSKGKEAVRKQDKATSSRIQSPPMHSTPLKHKSQLVTSLSTRKIPTVEEERKQKELERIYGVGIEDESDYEPTILSIRKARRSGSIGFETLEQVAQGNNSTASISSPKTTTKTPKTTLKQANAAKLEAKAKRSAVPPHLPTVRGVGLAQKTTDKMTQSANKAPESLRQVAIQDNSNAKMLIENCSVHNVSSIAEVDQFGFSISNRNLKAILSQKASNKHCAQLQPVKMQPDASQTQEDEQSTPYVDPANPKSTAISKIDRGGSPPNDGFARLQKITQEATIKARSDELTKSDVHFSSDLSELDPDLEDDIQMKVAKTVKGARNKKKMPAVDEEKESDRPKTVQEILSLLHDTAGGTKNRKPMTQGGRGGRKNAIVTKAKLEMQVDNDSNQIAAKISKPRKGKSLVLKEDDSSQVMSKNTRATRSDATKELDEYDIPPGMTLKEVTKNKAKKPTILARAKAGSLGRGTNPNNAATTKGSTRPKPNPRPIKMASTENVDWDTLPGRLAKGTTPRRASQSRNSQSNQEAGVVAQEVETQPIITVATKKGQKRKSLPEQSEDEAEVSNTERTLSSNCAHTDGEMVQDSKAKRARNGMIEDFDSLESYRLTVERSK